MNALCNMGSVACGCDFSVKHSKNSRRNLLHLRGSQLTHCSFCDTSPRSVDGLRTAIDQGQALSKSQSRLSESKPYGQTLAHADGHPGSQTALRHGKGTGLRPPGSWSRAGTQHRDYGLNDLCHQFPEKQQCGPNT